MKRTLFILAIIVVASAVFTSCSVTKGGCKGTQGFVGYGSHYAGR